MVDTSEQTVHPSKLINFPHPRVANKAENKDIREAEEGAVGPHNTNNLPKTQPGWESEQRQNTPLEHLGSARYYGKATGSNPHSSKMMNKLDPGGKFASKHSGNNAN